MRKNSTVRRLLSLFDVWCRKCSKFHVNYHINARADERIAELDRKEIELKQRVANAQRELAEIPQARQDRNNTLQARRADTNRLKAEHDQAISYARLSHQTDRASFAVRSVGEAQKRHAEAERLAEEVERTVTQANEIATTCAEELTISLQQWQAELETVRRECTATEAARGLANEELGRKKTDEYKRILKEKYRDPIKVLGHQRITLQVEMQEFLSKAQEALLQGDWYGFYQELVDAEHEEEE